MERMKDLTKLQAELNHWLEVFCKEFKELPAHHFGTVKSLQDAGGIFFWHKNLDGAYLWANAYFIKYFLLQCSLESIQGATDMEIAQRNIDKGIEFTPGPLCTDSDRIVIETEKPGIFIEDFVVDGKYMVLQVHKYPIFHNGKLSHTIGIGIEITNLVSSLKGVLERVSNCGVKDCKADDLVNDVLKQYEFLK